MAFLFESGFESGGIQCEGCNPDGWVVDTSGSKSDVKVIPFGTPAPRDGRFVAKFTLNKDMTFVGPPRAELSAIKHKEFFTVGKEYWVAWSILIDENCPFDSLQPEILTQFKKRSTEHDTLGSPSNSLQLINGHWLWVINWTQERFVTKANIYRAETDLGPASKNSWSDFVVHIKFAHDSEGQLEIWRNNTPVLERRNLPNYFNVDDGPYLKVGLYKPHWFDRPSSVKVQTIYIDSVHVFEGGGGKQLFIPTR